MTAINVTRVTVDQSNDTDDFFSFESCLKLQGQGKQIVRASCSHLMEEQGLIRWALKIINRPMGQDQVIRCPLCRTDLTDNNQPSIFYAEVIRAPENQIHGNQIPVQQGHPPVRGERRVQIIRDEWGQIERTLFFVSMIVAYVIIKKIIFFFIDL